MHSDSSSSSRNRNELHFVSSQSNVFLYFEQNVFRMTNIKTKSGIYVCFCGNGWSRNTREVGEDQQNNSLLSLPPLLHVCRIVRFQSYHYFLLSKSEYNENH